MLILENIYKSYGAECILQNVSHCFEEGKVYGLIGENGAGKTTLLKIISRLLSDNQGSIYIDDVCIDKKDYFKIPISYITDTPIYYTDLSVQEHLLTICYSQKMGKKKALEKIGALMNSVRLEQYRDYFPTALSKGTLQRLNLAMGLLREEKIILMDEPFSSLDPVQVSLIENIIKNLRHKKITQIISSHDIDSLQEICDVFIILNNKNITEYNPDNLNKAKITELIKENYEV